MIETAKRLPETRKRWGWEGSPGAESLRYLVCIDADIPADTLTGILHYCSARGNWGKSTGALFVLFLTTLCGSMILLEVFFRLKKVLKGRYLRSDYLKKM